MILTLTFESQMFFIKLENHLWTILVCLFTRMARILTILPCQMQTPFAEIIVRKGLFIITYHIISLHISHITLHHLQTRQVWVTINGNNMADQVFPLRGFWNVLFFLILASPICCFVGGSSSSSVGGRGSRNRVIVFYG